MALPMPPHDSDNRAGEPDDSPAALPFWPDSPDWMTRGACQGSDPELFFPIAAAGYAVAEIDSAKAVCARCEVAGQCLTFALATMPDGIWGGTTREERIALRARPAARQPRAS